MTQHTATARHTGLGLLAASVPMFMVALDNLVVTNALPSIRNELDATEVELQWVVNAYVLAFAGLLLTGAALGDRFGRRRTFVGGIVLFIVGSIGSALSGSIGLLIAARVVQGVGAAAVQPLSLTLVAGAVPPGRRNAAIGLWGGINGIGVALGPMVGGAVTAGLSWQWIFWINVPIALLVLPLIRLTIVESHGRDRELDLPGVLLVTAGVTLGVLGIVQSSRYGWVSPLVFGPLAASGLLVTLFVRWERRAPVPLLPLHFYRIRAFVLSNVVSMAMFFGVFGSVFFLNQYMQGPMGFDPLRAGLSTLPWTAMPMLVAPLTGLVVDRIGGSRLMAAGLALQAVALGWLALVVRIDTQYPTLVPALVVGGIGMGLVFAPTMAVVLGSVRPHEYGKASGANNTVREIGGALGVAVLTTVFRHQFVGLKILSPVEAHRAFVHGMVVAVWVGVAVVAAGAVVALFIPRTAGIAREFSEERPGGASTPERDEVAA
ncbi:MFS transporter [Micromonospora rifamycinica]|uniref:MFS transporter n=1 Tax=Micromonospora rifamycinica TaxID=291594 RepID=UPI003447532B